MNVGVTENEFGVLITLILVICNDERCYNLHNPLKGLDVNI